MHRPSAALATLAASTLGLATILPDQEDFIPPLHRRDNRVVRDGSSRRGDTFTNRGLPGHFHARPRKPCQRGGRRKRGGR